MLNINKKIHGFTILLFLLVAFSFNSFAQNRVIKGTVSDESGVSMVGVTVIHIDKNNRMLNGTVTNIDGVYTLRCNGKTPTLKFSFVGFEEQRVVLKDNQSIQNIKLKERDTDIDEVVITGIRRKKVDLGYLTIDKRDATGAVSVVKLDDVVSSHVSDVGEMLQGQSAGLMVTSNSGDPGSGVTIKIRGSASLNAGSSPLIVIDGVPTEIDGSFDNLEDFTDYSRSPLSDVNPEDIESITVLKDASSTAIYGSRGANGVILIKTKRGHSGKTIVGYSAKFSTQPGKEYLPLLNGDDLKTLWLEMDQNAYGLNNSFSGSLTRPELRDDLSRDDYEYFNNNTAWTDLITTDGFKQDHSVSVSGGGDAVKFSVNFGFVDQKGNIVNTDYSKYSSSFKLDYRLSDKVSFRGNIYYNHHDWSRTKGLVIDKVAIFDSPLSVAYRRPSFLPAYSPGSPNEYSYFYWESENQVKNINPLAQAMNGVSDKNTDKLSANISLRIQILKGLSLNAYVAYKTGNTEYDTFFPYDAVLRTHADGTPFIPWTNSSVNGYNFGSSSSEQFDASNALTYSINKNKHDFSFTTVQSIVMNNSSSFAYNGANTGSDDLQHANATNNWLKMSASATEKVVIGFRAKLIYNFDDRYGIDMGLNTDGSSNFGPGYRWGLFPNAGAFWRLSSESFADSWDWLDDCKFRVSWGQAGRPPKGSYNHLSTYKRRENGYNGQHYVIPGKTQLNNLRWETSETFDLGLELQLFKNRVYAEVGYYHQTTFDLLTNRLFPSSSGINDKDSKLQQNFGDMENKGIEMSFNVTPIKTKNLKWDFRINMATSRSKITRWPTQDTEWSNAGEETQGMRYTKYDDYAFYLRVREGDPLGAFYGYQTDKKMPVYSVADDVRVYGADGNVIYNLDGKPLKKYNSYSRHYFEAGDVNYVDQNNDGVIDDLDIVYLGDSNPDLFGGMSHRITYKNWSASVFFNYMVGNDILNWTKYGGELLKNPTNYTTSVMKRWREPGDITEIPRAVNGSITSYNNELGGDRYVEDGSYIRLQSVALSYIVPKNVLNNIFIKNASITFSAYNLYTWTKYTGVDPEVSYAGAAFKVGVDKSQTPKQSSYTLNLKLSF